MIPLRWIAPDQIAVSVDAARAGPTPADLVKAPRLTAWSVVIEPIKQVAKLRGRVTGHPSIDDPVVTTSAVVALDAGGEDSDGWARTLSRWYRLDGAGFLPADPAAREEELTMLQYALAGYRWSLAAALEARRSGAEPE